MYLEYMNYRPERLLTLSEDEGEAEVEARVVSNDPSTTGLNMLRYSPLRSGRYLFTKRSHEFALRQNMSLHGGEQFLFVRAG